MILTFYKKYKDNTESAYTLLCFPITDILHKNVTFVVINEAIFIWLLCKAYALSRFM